MHYKYWLVFLVFSNTIHSMSPGLAVAAKTAQVGLAENMAASSAATATASQRFHQAIQQIAQNNTAHVLKNASQISLDTILDVNSPLFKEFCELHTAGKTSVLKEKLAQLKEIVASNQSRPMLYEKKQIVTLEFLLKQEVVANHVTLNDVINTAKEIAHSKPVS